jgi:hypothetical protein
MILVILKKTIAKIPTPGSSLQVENGRRRIPVSLAIPGKTI